jgi:hypothetical protein
MLWFFLVTDQTVNVDVEPWVKDESVKTFRVTDILKVMLEIEDIT